MYSQIASNKRRSVIFIGLFFVIWLAIGAACGLLFKAVYRHSANNGVAGHPTDQLRLDPGHHRHGDRAVSGGRRDPLLPELRGRRWCCGSRGQCRPTRPSTSSCTTWWRPSLSARGSPSLRST